jgi:hypothetical protein
MLNPPKTGEIWFALLADPGTMPSKSRAVLVVEPYVYEDGEFEAAFVLGITSKVSGKDDGTEYVLAPNKANGLEVESAVKFFWGKEVERKYIDKQRQGVLTREEFTEVVRMLIAFKKKHTPKS